MDVNPAFDIDMISLPDYRIIDSITIDSLYIGTDLLLFKNAEKVSIASFSPAGERVIFALDYAYPTGSSDRIECVIAFDRGQVNQPICHLQSKPQACLNTTDNVDDEGLATSTHCRDAIREDMSIRATRVKGVRVNKMHCPPCCTTYKR
ncbi:hypothetical protein JCM19237_1968 [Photobacterium aphoticum]|uniref:Uncharacterized protein n=1 Tax=Photobacterium aphoticum TaxID=754436 RepID=A0A090QVM3_9GAMM|nr:hypothetical protein JCM19237_1968 [Photobacterium aphoticum]